MKNVLLFALCWLLPLSYSSAQKTLSPSAHKVSVELTPKAQTLLRKAGFEIGDKRALGGPKTLTTLQLDSTITYFGYNPATQDSFPQKRTVYTYLPQANAEIETAYIYDFDQWTPLTRATSYHDDQDRMIELYAELYDPSTQDWTPDSRLELFPRGNSPELLDSAIVSGWAPDVNDFVRLMTTWNVFDDQERIAESNTLMQIVEPPVQFKDIYYYDDNGDNNAILSYVVDGNMLIPAGLIEYTYDNHYVTSTTYLQDNGFGFIIELERITYTYTPFWKEEEVKYFVFDNAINDWKLTQSSFYQYDEQQRLYAHDLSIFNDETEDDFERTIYEYLEGEYLSRETVLVYFFGQEEEILERKYYFYTDDNVSDTPNLPVTVNALNMSPNPTFDIVQIQLEDEARLQVFNMQGQLMQQFTLQPGYMTVDLNNLPAGLYQVQAQTSEGYYAGKLVKQ